MNINQDGNSYKLLLFLFTCYNINVMYMSTILISINPEHVEKIMLGIKKCEFRTRKPNRVVDKMVIYETSPTKRVVAECILEEVLTLPKEELWNRVKNISGTTKTRFDNYFKKQEYATGFIIKEVKRCNKELIDYGIKFVPQSYIYLD